MCVCPRKEAAEGGGDTRRERAREGCWFNQANCNMCSFSVGVSFSLSLSTSPVRWLLSSRDTGAQWTLTTWHLRCTCNKEKQVNQEKANERRSESVCVSCEMKWKTEKRARDRYNRQWEIVRTANTLCSLVALFASLGVSMSLSLSLFLSLHQGKYWQEKVKLTRRRRGRDSARGGEIIVQAVWRHSGTGMTRSLVSSFLLRLRV